MASKKSKRLAPLKVIELSTYDLSMVDSLRNYAYICIGTEDVPSSANVSLYLEEESFLETKDSYEEEMLHLWEREELPISTANIAELVSFISSNAHLPYFVINVPEWESVAMAVKDAILSTYGVNYVEDIPDDVFVFTNRLKGELRQCKNPAHERKEIATKANVLKTPKPKTSKIKWPKEWILKAKWTKQL